MSAWNIDTDTVIATLKSLGLTTDELSTALAELQQVIPNLEAGVGGDIWLASLTSEVSPMLEEDATKMGNVVQRLLGVQYGASVATIAYQQGDDEMANAANAAGAAAAEHGDFSFFGIEASA